jgi:ATP-dependent DNA helicase 2 subunit 1
MNKWGIILDEQVRAHQKSAYGGIDGTAIKRDADDDEEEKPKKKVKTEKAELSTMSTSDLKKMVVKGTLGKHTVAELKDLLYSKGINASGKKQDLIDRIEQWVEDN